MRRAVGALGSGLLLDLAFPPHDLWWLAPVAVALFTASCRGTTVRRATGLGLVHGLGLFLPLLVWTGTIAGAPAWIALCLMEAVFLALLGGGLCAVQRLDAWPVWVSAAWVTEEALRDRLPFGGFTWGRLAFSQGDSPLTPLAAVGGAPLVTFAVAALGASLLALMVTAGPVSRWRRSLALSLGPALIVLAFVVPTPTTGRVVNVAVVQGNVPRLGLDAFAQRAAVLTNHVNATHELAAGVRAGRFLPPALVVWPENASDLDPYSDPEAAQVIDAAVREVGVPTLVGAVTDGPGRYISNRGIVWDPNSGPGATYVKRHPVPFGEYIPLRAFVRKLSKKVDLVPNDFAHGSRPGILQVGPARIGDVICFEVAYDGLVRDVVRGGGQLIVVQTNNATFGHSGETTQQLAMGRLRAVEHGRSVVVAATSGVSAVIAPDGRVQDRSHLFTKDLIVQPVVLRSARTLSDRLGSLPELLLALLGLGACVVGARR